MFEKFDDENRLWNRSEELQEIFAKSSFIYKDDELTRYVNEVLQKLVAEYQGTGVFMKAYVLRDPFFNAFCLSNGVIYVHTSILASADNEAQLATLLGHEATHFLHRHILRQFRSAINKSAFISFVDVTLGPASAYVGSSADLARLLGEYCTVGSFYGYTRDLERDADQNAFKLVTGAGYPVEETKKLFEHLYEATKDDKTKVPYFYSTHPLVKERIRNFERLIKEFNNTEEGKAFVPKPQDDKRYNDLTRKVLLDNIELEIKCNKLKLARKQIEKYNRLWPGDAKGFYFLGKVDFLEGKKEDAENALKKCVELVPDFAEGHKYLGLLYYKDGKKDKAYIEFEKYLKLHPQAPDAEYIRRYMDGKDA